MTWIDAVAHPVVAYLSNTLGPGLMLAVLVWAMLRFGFKLSAASRYVIFYGTLLMIASLPLISHIHFSFDFSAAETDAVMESALNENENVNPLAERKPSSKQVEIAPTVPTGTEIETVAASSDSAATSTWNISELFSISLFGLWALGVIGWMVVLSKNVVSLRKLKRSATPLLGYQDCLNQCLEQTKVKRRIKLMASDQISVPMSIGFFQPMILLPTHMIEQLNETELNHVLLHEIAHLKRRDDWTKLLQKLIRSAFFFHPAVWWLDRQLDFEREVACDDWVIQQQQPHKEYALNLIKIAEHSASHQNRLLTSAFFTKKTLKRRVNMILKKKDQSSHRFGKLQITTIGAILLFAIVALSQLVPLVGISSEATSFQHLFLAKIKPEEDPNVSSLAIQQISLENFSNEVLLDNDPANEQNINTFTVHPSNIAFNAQDGKLYWVSGLMLERTTLDGQQLEAFEYTASVDERLTVPGIIDFEIHSENQSLYAIIDGHGIVSGGLEGGPLTDIITQQDVAIVTGDPFARFFDVELDEINDKLYMLTTKFIGNSIFRGVLRANLDGSDLELVTSIKDLMQNIAVDPVHQKVYWETIPINQPALNRTIQRASLDGSNIETVVTIPRNEPVFNLLIDGLTETLYWSSLNTERPIDFRTTTSSIQSFNLRNGEANTVISGNFFILDISLGS